MKRIAIALIHGYQRTLSPDHGLLRVFYPGGVCRWHPTCSEYGALSIEKHGMVVGALQTLKRILRCHPWSQGGVDEP